MVNLPGRLGPALKRSLPSEYGVVSCRTWPPLREVEVAAVLAWSIAPASTAEAIRRSTAAPLLLLTATSESDRAMALRLGADLCLSPDSGPELVAAQLEALLRRVPARSSPKRATTAGRLRVDLDARRIYCGAEELALSPREFSLLAYLAGQPGVARRRYDILAAVWGSRFIGDSKTVDVHIAWLRQKLPRDAGVRLTTLRGVGYRLDTF
ncbi:MAG: response regulator transcription factor [Candidatus Dormibacteraeota bacterium]|nr:response regulator transcription factor [Candidatus Dormibacteraeota bacterium]